MKNLFCLFVLGVFCLTYAAGCGSMKTSKTPEELAALQDSAIRGEDIPLEEISDSIFVEPEDRDIVGVFEDVRFGYNKSNVREQDYDILNKIGRWQKNNPGYIIMIEGHCDERGSNEYNMALGEQRALSIRRYLIGLGVDSASAHTVSYGEEKPLDPGHNESAWSKNRRAHFLVAE